MKVMSLNVPTPSTTVTSVLPMTLAPVEVVPAEIVKTDSESVLMISPNESTSAYFISIEASIA